MTLKSPAAARIGDALATVVTPSLVVDLDAFEVNLTTMAAFAAHHGVALRPHAKAHKHKSSAIALQQIAAGAVGVCCQKVSEAYPFAAVGISSIHISNELVGADKVAMAVELASHTRLSVCVDALSQVRALGDAAARADVTIDVLLEIDAGQHRCGVTSEDELLALIDGIAAQSALRFTGIQAYHSGLQHIAGFEARSMRRGIVTGGGTDTVEFDAVSGVYNEFQPGSYLFMDGDTAISNGRAQAIGKRVSMFFRR